MKGDLSDFPILFYDFKFDSAALCFMRFFTIISHVYKISIFVSNLFLSAFRDAKIFPQCSSGF